ncbi:hypothetical protein K435DRAFT_873610 [Dendrothele bispora CBS 962.96]|uniref:Uncharacterized protein n=1 Tax=Dendrothele bispora (strain CBS 962.96) TaxID=1314807 RepID=A0A4S8KZ43_DENBC|nr:hypothetical protein K435DRAFT_873610 [Dendrothele bispora CBS 962.96]
MSNAWIRLDDTDSRIAYQGTWWIGGRQAEYNGTTHGLKDTSDSSASLRFNGIQVKVVATLDAGNSTNPNPIADIHLDGNLALRYAPNLSSSIQFQQSIFSSSILNEGDHMLSISSEIDTDDAIWLDYFEYLPSNPSISTQSPTTSSASTFPSATSTTSTIQNAPLDGTTSGDPPASTTQDDQSPASSNTSQSSTDASTSKKESLTAGSIVGIISGVVFLGVVLAGVFLLWKRNKKRVRRLKGYSYGDIQPYPIRSPVYLTSPNIYQPPSSALSSTRLTEHTSFDQPPSYSKSV